MTAEDDAPRGDCALVALNGVANLPNAKLVHGHPIGRSGEAAGQRYWHAWVEVTVHGRTVVVDMSNGLEIVIARGAYYRLGQIRDVRRYTFEEATAKVAEFGHAGPWDGTVPPYTQEDPDDD